jgi:hypothetical protein
MLELMLLLISRAMTRWSDHTDLVLLAGDFNTCCRQSVGYVESETSNTLCYRNGAGRRVLPVLHRRMRHGRVSKFSLSILDGFAWLSKPDQMARPFRVWIAFSRLTHG